MKAIGFLTFLPLMATLSVASAKSELDILRSRCSEQERQIHQLEEENRRLKGDVAPPKVMPSLATGGIHMISTAPEKELPSKAPSSPAAEPKKQGATYTVRKGDSFERIARHIHTTAQALADANGLAMESVLHPGQILQVPGAGGHAAKPPAVAKEPHPPTPSPAEPGNEAATSDDATSYTIRQGDTYYGIALKYHTSPALLQKLNPSVKATALRPGLVIRLKKVSVEKPKASEGEAKKSKTTKQSESKSAGKAGTKPSAKGKPEPKPEPKPSATPAAREGSESAPNNKKDDSPPAFDPLLKNEPAPAKTSSPATVPAPAKKTSTTIASVPAKTPSPAPAPTPAKTSSPAPAPTPAKTSSAAPAPALANNATPSQPVGEPTKKPGIHPVPVTEKVTFGEFATKHGTSIAKLNELNGLSLTSSTILAEGSELYIPAQP